MQSYVNVGWTREFKLNRALLMYGQSNYNGYPYRHPFITVHDVVHQEGDVRLGPAELLTPEMLRTLMAEMGQSQLVEILPENVIARTADVVVWWSPAQVRTMFFSDRGGDKTLQKLNGKRYPHPPLLFRAAGGHLWIRALRRNERPKADSKLCMAPYWNCYDNGSVCTGTMRIPHEKSVSVHGGLGAVILRQCILSCRRYDQTHEIPGRAACNVEAPAGQAPLSTPISGSP